jgi:hypothetical protein
MAALSGSIPVRLGRCTEDDDSIAVQKMTTASLPRVLRQLPGTRQDVVDAVIAPADKRFVFAAPLSRLVEELHRDEIVIAIVCGVSRTIQPLLTVTNLRVILVTPPAIGRDCSVVSVPIANVTTVARGRQQGLSTAFGRVGIRITAHGPSLDIT